MKTNHTDEQIQAAIDAACEEINSTAGPLATLELSPSSVFWKNETPIRLCLLKTALDLLPEPPPPVVDGKTPGQVAWEAHSQDRGISWSWVGDQPTLRQQWEHSASAVLAAFGRAGLAEANNLLDWAESILCNSKPMSHYSEEEWDATIKKWRDQRHGLISAAREGQPASQPAEIPWTPWNGGTCPLKDEEVEEWGYKASDGFVCNDPVNPPQTYTLWEDSGDKGIIAYRVTKWRKGFGPVAGESEEEGSDQGVNGFELQRQINAAIAQLNMPDTTPENLAMQINKKIMERDEIHMKTIARAEKAEAELAAVKESLESQRRVFRQDNEALEKRLYAAESKPQLSILRPIAEAGEVPAGCVRVYFAYDEERWQQVVPPHSKLSHFADIRLPESKTPDVIHEGGEVFEKVKTVDSWEDDDSGVSVHIRGFSETPQSTREALGEMVKLAAGDMKAGKFDKPTPETFTAHGKEWFSHVPGDPMPCDGQASVFVTSDNPDVLPHAKAARDWHWGTNTEAKIIGWRYAEDEPSGKPTNEATIAPEWTPVVGDVVTLKSGGLKMTILELLELKGCPAAGCEWFNPAGEYDSGTFKLTSITKADS